MVVRIYEDTPSTFRSTSSKCLDVLEIRQSRHTMLVKQEAKGFAEPFKQERIYRRTRQTFRRFCGLSGSMWRARNTGSKLDLFVGCGSRAISQPALEFGNEGEWLH